MWPNAWRMQGWPWIFPRSKHFRIHQSVFMVTVYTKLLWTTKFTHTHTVMWSINRIPCNADKEWHLQNQYSCSASSPKSSVHTERRNIGIKGNHAGWKQVVGFGEDFWFVDQMVWYLHLSSKAGRYGEERQENSRVPTVEVGMEELGKVDFLIPWGYRERAGLD